MDDKSLLIGKVILISSMVLHQLACQERQIMSERKIDMFRADARHTAAHAAKPIREIHGIKWSYDLVHEVSATPVIASKVLITVGVAQSSLFPVSYLHALDAETGKVLWRTNRKEIPGGVTTPAIADSVVCFGTSQGEIMALNLHDGETMWEFSTGSPVRAEPIISDGIVYAGDLHGNFYALDQKIGALKWQHRANGHIISSAALANGIIYVPYEGSVLDNTAYLYGLDIETGKVLSKITSLCPHSSTIVIAGNNLLYFELSANEQEKVALFAIDIAREKLQWQFDCGLDRPTLPAFSRHIVCLGTQQGTLYALDNHSGKMLWKFAAVGPCSSPIIAEGVVYFSTRAVAGQLKESMAASHIYALDLLTGNLLWKDRLNELITTDLNVDDEKIYFGSRNGLLFCLH